MEKLSVDIQTYHLIQSDIAKLECRKIEIAKDIIKNECPYKIGNRVEFYEWRNTTKVKYGIIKRIYFNGFNSDAIDNKWVIEVLPTKKKNSKTEVIKYAESIGAVITKPEYYAHDQSYLIEAEASDGKQWSTINS